MDHLMGVERTESTPRERRSLPDSEIAAAALSRCPVFLGLPESSLRRLHAASTLLRVARRRHVYRQDARAEGVFVVAGGRVRVIRAGSDARSLTVAYRSPGELFGETAMIAGGSYHDSATSTEQADVVQIPLGLLEALLAENAMLANRMLHLMIERRIDAERRVESLLSRSVESRVCEFLLEASTRHGIPESRGLLISVKYTHQEIADYVGSTRETVTLTLGELRRRGAILFDHRRIVVVSAERLGEFV